ncbi:MAG TPA: hypothetical protein VHC48_01225 [Puia sp.]|nr:hypothetical protein [Puia sp.]
MRKSLHEVQEIDRYIFRRMTRPDRLVFQARMILQPGLKEKVRLQQKAHAFLRWCSRKEKKDELTALYHRLMNDTAFHATIRSIFS